MTIQHHSFGADRGFVLHRIPTGLPTHARMSAWYDKHGNVLDAELLYFYRGGSRPVKRGGPLWKLARRQGRIYREHSPAPSGGVP